MSSFSVPRYPRDDVHRFRVPDDVPQTLRFQQRRPELSRRRLRNPMVDADRRVAEDPGRQHDTSQHGNVSFTIF